jgi:hypothetical protein
MKSAAEYLQGHVFEARRPRRELQPVVTQADAIKAIEQAVADAEKYRYLLMRALRRHDNDMTTIAPVAIPAASSFFTDAPVLPMYPGQERIAA